LIEGATVDSGPHGKKQKVQTIDIHWPRDYVCPMAGEASISTHPVSVRLWARTRLPRWPMAAWGAIAVTATFIAITCWWLTQDRAVPIFDAGLHLTLTIFVHNQLSAGHLFDALTLTKPYPPFAYLIGSLGIFAGGTSVAAPIVAENIVFVSLLALGCYKVGRLAFNPTAGLLAVIFALGSPMIAAQFHVVMIDAPETAMVAISVWAILATDGFSRVGVSALAGLAVGLGMLTKEPLAIFVVGVVAVTAVRGGRQAWRGLAVFTVIVLALALPWYLHELKQVGRIKTQAISGSSPHLLKDIAPPRWSLDNFEWYFWNIINAQILLPLFAFAAVGWVWTMVGFLRRRSVSRFAPELAVGAFVAWLGLTMTFVHDNRYSLPLLVYLAVFGSGWIVRLPRPGRIAAATVLVLVAIINTRGASFGDGWQLEASLPGANRVSMQYPGVLTVFSTGGYVISRPRRDGDVLATLRALRRAGVRRIGRGSEPTGVDFTEAGLLAFEQIAGLEELGEVPQTSLTRQDAILAQAPIEPGESPPCIRLNDGTGIWIRLGNPTARGARNYCPSRHPPFYGP
jgi:hypothetical protein